MLIFLIAKEISIFRKEAIIKNTHTSQLKNNTLKTNNSNLTVAANSSNRKERKKKEREPMRKKNRIWLG